MSRNDKQVICYILLCLLFLGIGEDALAQQPKKSTPPKGIQEVFSDGVRIKVSKTELQIVESNNHSGIKFSAKDFARQSYITLISEMQDEKCAYQRNFTLLSVVGSIISLKDVETGVCSPTAHPFGESRFIAFDILKPGSLKYQKGTLNLDLSEPSQAVKLTDLFQEKDIFNALISNYFVRSVLRDLETKDRPKTLPDLISTLSSKSSLDGKSCFSVAGDFLTRFAFHHIENDKVEIRIALSGSGPCREQLTQLGIILPIPTSLKGSLKAAASKNQGLLMKNTSTTTKGKTVRVEFSDPRLR